MTSMDDQFDHWTRILAAAASRRVALRSLVRSTVAAGLGRLGLDQAAAKNKRNKRKKLKKNAFGCVNVGGRCRGKNAACCSGICQGKKPKKGEKDTSRCVAHNVLDCPAGANSCQGLPVACGTNGLCNQTTGRASYCGRGGTCFACTKDVDCAPVEGPGAACVVCPLLCPEPGTFCAAPAD
jgi:hypothetical protein